jgi:hypothetical protein
MNANTSGGADATTHAQPRPDSRDSLRQSLAPEEWDVFISYSRKDDAFAIRLHAALNNYHPPSDLSLPQRRLRVFLDTADFVAPDYKPVIRRHLKNASKLIVICSPNAASSRFVGPEIDDFIALHPLARPVPLTPEVDGATRGEIISVIIDGLPINETAGATDPRNAFPEALCRALELPIAIDYRAFDPRQHKLPEGQYRNAWFTLLASIYGHDRATIEERERKRRTRILRVRAAVASTVAVGLLALSVWALFERQAALEQRTRAYARQLAAQAQVGLADVRSPAAPAVVNAVASLSLERTEEAVEALKTGVKRLPPLPLGRLPLAKEDGVPVALTFSRDGRLLLGMSKDMLLIWQAQERAVVIRHPIHGTASIVAFSPDSTHAAVVVRADEKADATRLVVLDIQARKVAEHVYARVLDCTATRNGLRALISDAAGRNLQIVDLVSGRVEREIPLAHAAKIARLAPMEGGVFLVDTVNDVWSLASDRTQKPAKHSLGADAIPLAFAVHAGLLAVETTLSDGPRPIAPASKMAPPHATAQRGLQIIEAATGRPLMEVKKDAFHGFIDFVAGDRFFRIKGERGIDFYDVSQRRLMLTVENSRATDYNRDAMSDVTRQMPAIDAAASEDGALLVIALKDGRVTAWRPGLRPRYGSWGALPMPSLEPLAQFDHGDTLGASATWVTVPALFVSPDGRYIASQSDGLKTNTVGGIVSATPMLRVWDVYRREEIARFQSPGGMVIVFAASGDIAATMRPSKEGGDTADAELDLWRLSADASQVDRSSEKLADLLPQADISMPNPSMTAASADGRRLVWLGLDGRLRMRDGGSKAVEVIDELRPRAQRVFADLAANWPKKVASLEPRAREAFAGMPPPTDAFAQLDAWVEKTRGGDKSLLGQAPPIGSLAVSGDGCCVLVVIGPLLRLYSLDDRRLITERILSDMVPGSIAFWSLPAQSLLLSHDGHAFAVSVDTWADFEAAVVARQEREDSSDHKPPLAKRQLRIFSRDADAPTGTVDQFFLPTPGPLLPLNWPLAIDSQGRQLALQQISLKDGLVRRVAVVRPPDWAAGFETSAESWAFHPLDAVSTATVMARRAAFSQDNQRLVTTDTKPACVSAQQTSAALMSMMVPICPQLTSTVEVWALATGRRIAETSFDFTPDSGGAPTQRPPIETKQAVATMPAPMAIGLPVQATRQIMALSLTDDWTVIQSGVDGDLRGASAVLTLVTERIRLDDAPLINRACARLPSDARSIRREDWLRDLPGEPYRPICK